MQFTVIIYSLNPEKWVLTTSKYKYKYYVSACPEYGKFLY
jgi:hypothetical protein